MQSADNQEREYIYHQYYQATGHLVYKFQEST